METQAQFIGGIIMLLFFTFLASLIAVKKKPGVMVSWLIGFGIGLLISFILGTSIGVVIGIIASIISAIVFPKQKKQVIYKGASSVDATKPSVADELAKLNSLKEQGVINEDEFNKQKEKLLS